MTSSGELSEALGEPWWIRLRAVLATGLVLGVGAGSTLAAWTDQATVTGTFSTSIFVLEVNTSSPYDGAESAWTPGAGGTAELRFDAVGMTPGSTRYAPLALRTSDGSIGGTAQISAASVEGAGLADALSYRAIVSQACDENAFADAPYLIGGPAAHVPFTAEEAERKETALQGIGDDLPHDPVHLCFEVLLHEDAPNELQGQTATVSWTIDATSVAT